MTNELIELFLLLNIDKLIELLYNEIRNERKIF